MESLYGGGFHDHRDKDTRAVARKILAITLGTLPAIKSALDLGCGVGTWLSVLEEFAVEDILGVDGPWVKPEQLVISAEKFQAGDLRDLKPIERKFDLALSFEVAEHLPASFAREFIKILTSAADFVLFSAATPHQGGTGHINEQWPDYWIRLFEECDFVALDLVRRKIWLDSGIPKHYRKNILFFSKKSRLGDIVLPSPLEDYTPPEKYLLYYPNLTQPGIKQSANNLYEAIRKRLAG